MLILDLLDVTKSETDFRQSLADLDEMALALTMERIELGMSDLTPDAGAGDRIMAAVDRCAGRPWVAQLNVNHVVELLDLRKESERYQLSHEVVKLWNSDWQDNSSLSAAGRPTALGY